MSDEEIAQFEFELQQDLEGFSRNHIDPEFERKEHDIQHSIS